MLKSLIHILSSLYIYSSMRHVSYYFYLICYCLNSFLNSSVCGTPAGNYLSWQVLTGTSATTCVFYCCCAVGVAHKKGINRFRSNDNSCDWLDLDSQCDANTQNQNQCFKLWNFTHTHTKYWQMACWDAIVTVFVHCVWMFLCSAALCARNNNMRFCF